MKVLFLALAPNHFYRKNLISNSDQLFIGPDVDIESSSFEKRAIHMKLCNITSQELNRKFRLWQWWPDITFVKADATMRIYIRNIEDLPGKKVLLMGDTHHLYKPIQAMISYACNEKWDLISSEHDRHHLPLFKEAGLKNLIWLPCFTMNSIYYQPKYEVKNDVVFVGSLSEHHFNRISFLDALNKLCTIPLKVMHTNQKEAAKIFNNSIVSLNISLNGDLNFRIMEILAAGGLLLTDQLGPDSGLDLLMRENEHYLSFTSVSEAEKKIKWLIENPTIRYKIAKAGHEEFWNKFSPQAQTQALFSALKGEEFCPLFNAPD